MSFLDTGKTFVIAEIGVNHEGSPEVAAQLIRLAAESGADAVKFQTFRAENYVSKVQEDRFNRVKKFQLSEDNFIKLAAIAEKEGIIFFSTPLHEEDVDFLDKIVPFYKISSGDLTYLNLIKRVAQKGKPIIISTGLGTKEEIKAAIDVVLETRPDIIEKGELVLMHCVAAYPTPAEEANLLNIEWLRDNFQIPVGYSDHTLGIKACELAVAVGAVVIEKHFTYRKEDQIFHDHKISADPEDMKELIVKIREAEVYLGKKERTRGASEEKMLTHMRRSIGASIDIPSGVKIQKEWLTFLRPAWGVQVEEYESLIGKELKEPIKAGELIMPENLK